MPAIYRHSMRWRYSYRLVRRPLNKKNYKMTHSSKIHLPALHVIFGTSILLNSLPLSVCQILTSPLPPVAKSALVLRGKTMSFTALPWHVLRRSGEISAKLSKKYFSRIFTVSEFLTNVYSVDVVFTCSTIYLMSVTADWDGSNATV